MKLIDNPASAWKLFSVQLAALAVAFGALPVDIQESLLTAIGIPSERVPAILGALFIVARLVSQTPKDEQ